jgi:hypothetical protein
MDYVLVGKLDGSEESVRTVAFCHSGQIAENFEYRLAGTPCARVIEGDLCVYPSGVQQSFPEDTQLVTMGVEAYAGKVLTDSLGCAMGLMAALDSRPIADPARVTAILRILAVRAAVELERLRTEEQFFQKIAGE